MKTYYVIEKETQVIKCTFCYGKGTITLPSAGTGTNAVNTMICDECGGTGELEVIKSEKHVPLMEALVTMEKEIAKMNEEEME